MSIDLIIIGAGGHAVSVTNVALSCGYSVIAYVENDKKESFLLGRPIISTDACYRSYPNHNYCVAIGDNSVRERLVDDLKAALPDAKFPTVVHKSSVIGLASEVGSGTVVMPNANIGPNSKVGSFCIVNTNSSIDHDCSMKDFSSIAPGVITGGNVVIGKRSAISIASAVKHGVTVGNDTVIGANSYVNKDVEGEVVAYGRPSKTIRNRKPGDSYLG